MQQYQDGHGPAIRSSYPPDDHHAALRLGHPVERAEPPLRRSCDPQVRHRPGALDDPVPPGGCGPPGVVSSFNMADVWEMAADAVPTREALVIGDRRLTYAALEERANRLAQHLSGRGIGPGDHVALYLENCPEYVEAMLAAYKLRAVSINVNHRYVAGELRYLLDNSDSVAVITQPSLAGTVAAVAPSLPALRFVADGGRRVRGRAGGGLARAPGGRAQRRRPLHHLHRRHHRPAQGRGVAPRRRLLRLHGRRRPVPAGGRGHPARRAARPDHGDAAHLPAAGPDDARGRAVDVVRLVLRRVAGRAHGRAAGPGRGVAHHRGRAGEPHHGGGRRRGPAPARRLGPGRGATTPRRCSTSPTAARRWPPPPGSGSSPPCPT